MPDVLADGRFGQDDGIKCDRCGSSTFLVYDDGGGLMAYECNDDGSVDCDNTFSVQYEWDSEEDCEPEGWEVALWEDQTGQRGIKR